jgi:hypothetical protein
MNERQQEISTAVSGTGQMHSKKYSAHECLVCVNETTNEVKADPEIVVLHRDKRMGNKWY